MDIWAIIGGVALILGIVASVVQVLEYLQKRREKPGDIGQQDSPSLPSPIAQAADAASEGETLAQKHLVLLRQILTERFDEGALQTLCFDLGVDYASLPGDGKADKARELVAYLERRSRISELIETGKQQRPDIVEWAQARLDVDMERLRARRDQADKARREMRERQRVVNLRPLDVTHTFKDRLREMQALCDHLADASVRLVSIVGRGGMGKTALASRVLADLERGMLPLPDEEKELPIGGILYLSARSTGLGLERVYTDVGRMLGEPAASRLAARWASEDTPLAAKVEYLLEAMQEGLYLILLDNLEDELNEDGEVAEEGLRLFVERCLTQPGGARLIATSREQVKVAAAALRNARNIPLSEGLPEEDAVALLCDLDPDGTLGLRDAPEEDLYRAVRLTQGIPRALEILAGILHEDPTASLTGLLTDADLFGERLVERLVAQGYRRLGEDERRVMEALAVFDRPVEETAIAYLLHPWFSGLDVQACLRRLVSGYFVNASRVTGEYSLHPLDRDHAYRHLPDNEEPDVYNRRNLELRAADFYASIRKPDSEWESIEDLAPQLAEFEHRVRAGDYDGACQVLNPIDFSHLHLWGHFARLVEMREKLIGRLTDPSLRMTNLGNLGMSYRSLGQFNRAIKSYEKALTIARKIGHDLFEGVWLGNLGSTYLALGRFEQAIKLHQEGLTIAREIGNRREEGIHLGQLGTAYRGLGQVKKAIELYMEALFIARELGNRRFESFWLNGLGDASRALRQTDKAIEFYEQGLAIAHKISSRQQESFQLLGLSRALLATGELSRAWECSRDALTLDLPRTGYQAALTLGIVLLHQRDLTAGEVFADTVARCQTMLDQTPDWYEARYTLAAALVGQAVYDPRWADGGERAELLAPALTEYHRALETCAAPGVVADALRDLELIRAAGIEGLEPVFELLESAAS